MRLLFVHPSASLRGGAQLALQWTMNGLAAKGHSVQKFQFSEDGFSLSPDVLQNQAARLALIAHDFDLIIACNFPATLWVGLARRQSKTFPPVLWNCNEPPRTLYESIMSVHFLRSSVNPKFNFPWTSRLHRKKWTSVIQFDLEAVSKFAGITAISYQTGAWVKKIYGRQPYVNVLGVGDLSPEKPVFSENTFTFFSPAGLEPIKNFKTILEAFKLASEKSPYEMRLILTGDGFWRASAEKLVKRWKIQDKIYFAGHVSREQLFEFYRLCDGVLFVPLDEPFGLVSCEAGLFGKPVIASSHGGPAEIVLDRKTGLLVNPLSPVEISEAMLELVRHSDLKTYLGQAAQNRIAEHYSFNDYLNRFDLYMRRL